MTPLRSCSGIVWLLLGLLLVGLPYSSAASTPSRPLSSPPACDQYLYAHANPVNGWDPSGHENLISIGVGSSISQSLSAMYNGVVTATGNALQATLFGVQAGKSADEILTGFIFDETGIGLAIDAFNAVRGLFQDRESQEVAAISSGRNS